jgi:arginine utilization regulatory protein
MPLELQAKLLRVLQDGKIRRVGDTKERIVDFVSKS